MTFDCIYNDGNLNMIPVEAVCVSDEVLIYNMSLENYTENVELRFFNYSAEPVTIESVHIEQVDN